MNERNQAINYIITKRNVNDNNIKEDMLENASLYKNLTDAYNDITSGDNIYFLYNEIKDITVNQMIKQKVNTPIEYIAITSERVHQTPYGYLVYPFD